MTQKLFVEEPYLKEFEATVIAADESGIQLDRTLFYPTSGGQPGDVGILKLQAANDEIRIATTRKGESFDDVIHIPAEGTALPRPGVAVATACRFGGEKTRPPCRIAGPAGQARLDPRGIGHGVGHQRLRRRRARRHHLPVGPHCRKNTAPARAGNNC